MSINPSFSEKQPREEPRSDGLQETPRDDSDFDSTDSEDNDDDDDETFMFRPPSPYRPPLDPCCFLARYREPKLKAAIQGFSEFKSLASQVQDSACIKTHAFRHQPTFTKPSCLAATTATAPPTHSPSPSSLLPCPFYVHNPHRYIACLHHNLQRPIDVKRHLWTSHRLARPYKCPTCGGAFEKEAACDAHIRQRACTNPTKAVPRMEHEDGLSATQIYQLVQLGEEEEEQEDMASISDGVDDEEEAEDQNYNPEEEDDVRSEWAAIWHVVFPDEMPPEDLENDNAMKEVALLREFWRKHGRELIAGSGDDRWVYDSSMQTKKGRRDVEALLASVLEGMIEDVLASLSRS
ncbi:hypothetical protein QBC47DRAFT_403362 [Echria macrotheca]|uniref:C2H2-type domain-containing protein n=1 Tax=Echria macrotheca TaxID=438768 RepID=A0AAJ0B937_9PEZI|nr:hypothetical protein QBC47DRAFT_403362 [Echria macrotheca]